MTFFEVDLMPSDFLAEVRFIGDQENVDPEFNDDNWDHVGTVKAERTDINSGDWVLSTEFNREIEPLREGFWTWGNVLVRVIPATIMESGLYVFKRKEVNDG